MSKLHSSIQQHCDISLNIRAILCLPKHLPNMTVLDEIMSTLYEHTIVLYNSFHELKVSSLLVQSRAEMSSALYSVSRTY